MLEIAIFAATFMGVLLVSTVVIGSVLSQRAVSARVDNIQDGADTFSSDIQFNNLKDVDSKDVEYIKNFFDVDRNVKDKNSIKVRLLRAGFLSKNAFSIYSLFRAISTFVIVVGMIFVLFNFFPSLSKTMVIVISFFAAAVYFIILNIFLEYLGNKRETAYRKLFPDFMDMLIVCVDAGLSVEASIDKISREFLKTHHDFGIHLSVMMLEVRGGRRLRDALMNFSQRLNIEEARALAILFRQSEELGSSVTKALRVFSKEMRDTRLLRAEEKANALPVKMLFPLATFLFPISLLIVMVPIAMTVIKMLSSMGAGVK